MYQLVFYVPEAHAQRVKEALFARGAGRIGAYDSCSWQTAGMGQFRPLAGSSPFVGVRDRLQQTPELKVEMVVPDEVVREVAEELLKVHPYEEPAYAFYRIESIRELGGARGPG